MTGVLLGVLVGAVVALCAGGAFTAAIVAVLRAYGDAQVKVMVEARKLAQHAPPPSIYPAADLPARPAQVRSRRLRAVEPPVPGVHDPYRRAEVGETWGGGVV